MLSTVAFAKWSKKVVLFVHNTSLCDDEPYPDLLQQKGGRGFPTVSYLDADGGLLKQVGYVTPLEQMEQAWQDLQKWKRLRAAVEGGNQAAVKELFLIEVEMANRPFAEMQATYQSLQFPEAQKPSLQQRLLNLQCAEILRSVPQKDLHLAGEKLVAIFGQDRHPEGMPEMMFWHALILHASWVRDYKLYEDVLAKLETLKKADEWWQDYIRERRADLPRLKAGK